MLVVIASTLFLPGIGGVQSVVDTLARALVNMEHQVIVLTREPVAGSTDESLPYLVMRYSSTFKRLQVLAEANLVIAFGRIFDVAVLGRLLGIRLIISHHITICRIGKIRSAIEWLKGKLVTRALEVACSRSLSSELGHIGVVGNPLRWDFDVRLDQSNSRAAFLFCGRLIPEKGADLLLRAFALLCQCDSEISLTIVGDGPQRQYLQELSTKLGVSSRVYFLGMLSGEPLKEAYRAHAVLIVPSLLKEAFGIVALEGLASGCRVVVTDCGGLPEAVGQLGLVAAPKPFELSLSMKRALQSSEIPYAATELEALCFHLRAHSPEKFARSLLEMAAEKWPDLSA